MTTGQTLRFLERAVTPFRRSRLKTLAAVVWGLLRGGQAGILPIGRAMAGPALPKHRIKRVDRFVGNSGVDPKVGMRALAALACGGRTRVVVAVDWTQVGSLLVLVAAVVTGRRAMPVCWAVGVPGTFARSLNAWEHAFFVLLRDVLPSRVRAVIVADRGFGRAQLGLQLRKLGLDFVIRVRDDVRIRRGSYLGRLYDLPLRRGRPRDLGTVEYREKKPIETRIVAFHGRAAKTRWMLSTSLTEDPRAVVQIYARRMEIEESFRDLKNVRAGFQLRTCRVGSPERLERLLLAVVFAYFILSLLGLRAEQQRMHHRLLANTARTHALSLARVGRLLTAVIPWTLHRLLPLAAALPWQPGNWG